MKNIVKRLGLVELPILELLEEVLYEHSTAPEEECKRIVLTFGRALKEAIAMRGEPDADAATTPGV